MLWVSHLVRTLMGGHVYRGGQRAQKCLPKGKIQCRNWRRTGELRGHGRALPEYLRSLGHRVGPEEMKLPHDRRSSGRSCPLVCQG